MTDTKQLLQRIAALRTRLSESAGSNPDALADKVERGGEHNALLEGSLRSADPAPATVPATLRLTGRGARLLHKGRELLQALRKVADDPEYHEGGDLAPRHREGVAMIEVVLRTVQAMPASVSAQLRMCDGLEVVLREVEERIAVLDTILAQRRQAATQIDELADCLRCLASQRPIRLPALQALADTILAEAIEDRPLRFLHASPAEPARFAAAHGLTTAQVLARLVHDDANWQPQAQLAVMAALVHDVGMTRVPAKVLLTEGPLDADQRRLIEKHTVVAEAMLQKLWPGGGWQVEAATCHHERNDGTGYPRGRQRLELAEFVRLLAVCDVYAALGCPRPHRPAFDTRTALTETLLLAERGYLDKDAAERLLRLSFYPVGSAIELNDGAIGIVVATHPSAVCMAHPDRPIVHLTGESWPIVVDLLAHKDRSILRGLTAAKRAAKLPPRFMV